MFIERGRAAALAAVVGMAAIGLISTEALAQLPVAGLHLTPLKAAAAPKGFAGVCARYSWACKGGAKGQSAQNDDAMLSRARRVNASVNGSVRSVPDQRQYGKEEYWALPTSGKGDCEDYALMKKHELLKVGVKADRLLLAQVFTGKLEPHMVLVIRLSSGDYVLDNLTSSIRHWKETGYTFVKMQNPADKSAWDAILLGPKARR